MRLRKPWPRRATCRLPSWYFDNPYFTQEPRLQQLALALLNARTVKTLHLPRIYPPFTGYLRQAFEGQIPAREALEQMELEINAAIAER